MSRVKDFYWDEICENNDDPLGLNEPDWDYLEEAQGILDGTIEASAETRRMVTDFYGVSSPVKSPVSPRNGKKAA